MKFFRLQRDYHGALSLPVRGAWIEILSSINCVVVTPSLPVRGAWIEIKTDSRELIEALVAPRAGSVD